MPDNLLPMKPACVYRQRELFTAPGERDDPATLLAQEICAGCPIKRRCAEHALTAGSSLDWHYRAPAVGVVQAGVYCDGSDRAARELAEAAGVTKTPRRGRKPRKQPDDHCVHCGRPMAGWRRGEAPAGRGKK